MTNILHLSHTNISSDSRILKEMTSIKNYKKNLKVFGLGINRVEFGNTKNLIEQDLEINDLALFTNKIKFLPKFIKRIIIFIEFYIKVFFKCHKSKIKPKVIHCHDVISLPISFLIKLIYKSKIIYDAHELESNMNGLSKIEQKIIFIIEKIFWKYVDHFITVSLSISKWYDIKLGKKDSSIIMNCPKLNTELKKIDKNYLRKRFNIGSNRDIYIYVGNLSKGRSVNILLEIFKDRNFKSDIVFLGYGDMKDQILEISQSFSNIHLHDKVHYDEVVVILKSANFAFCLIENVSLSDYYCLPNKLFEYTHAKIPIIASKFPEMEKFINKYKIGTCIDLNYNSLNDLILNIDNIRNLKIKNDSDLYKLSWEHQEKKLKKLYMKFL